MKVTCKRLLYLTAAAVMIVSGTTSAQSTDVASTLHNLSVSGPGDVRSVNETEVCKFCHIPHSTVVNEPLWGHMLSKVERYKMPTPRGARPSASVPVQPDGASRLCLSCHDGTIALGEVRSRTRIGMAGASKLTPGRRGFLGTDLSGGHPISIEMPEMPEPGEGEDMTLRPRSAVELDHDVRLDAAGKIQCTSCHDPHSDANYDEGSVPHFWVKPTVTEVCTTCHELR